MLIDSPHTTNQPVIAEQWMIIEAGRRIKSIYAFRSVTGKLKNNMIDKGVTFCRLALFTARTCDLRINPARNG